MSLNDCLDSEIVVFIGDMRDVGNSKDPVEDKMKRLT